MRENVERMEGIDRILAAVNIKMAIMIQSNGCVQIRHIGLRMRYMTKMCNLLLIDL